MQVSVLGIDLGKNVCSIVGLDASGAVILRRRVKRETLIGLGGKASALHRRHGGLLWRASSWPPFANQGHEVRLMSPEYVRPYVKAQKNDDRDAGPTSIDHRRQAELFGISKRGNKYLRKLLIHGARAACHTSPSATRRSADGPGICSPACTRMSPSWPWPTSWRGSPGRCCGAAKLHRQGSASGGVGIGWSAHKALIGRRCLRVVN